MDNKYGKNIFVTGASSGIGKACALKFAKNGCQVVGVSRAIDEGTETFPGGGTLARKRLDITNEAAAKDFIESLPDIDIAILCAGMGVAGPAESTPMELTRRQMEVNYFGTLNVAGPVLKRMREKGRGLLIIIGSIAGRVPIPMQSQYSSSKYALEAYVDAVRMEMKRFGEAPQRLTRSGTLFATPAGTPPALRVSTRQTAHSPPSSSAYSEAGIWKIASRHLPSFASGAARTTRSLAEMAVPSALKPAKAEPFGDHTSA